MKLKKFTDQYQRMVGINPEQVVSVTEGELPPGSWSNRKPTRISMKNGEVFLVQQLADMVIKSLEDTTQ